MGVKCAKKVKHILLSFQQIQGHNQDLRNAEATDPNSP